MDIISDKVFSSRFSYIGFAFIAQANRAQRRETLYPYYTLSQFDMKFSLKCRDNPVMDRVDFLIREGSVWLLVLEGEGEATLAGGDVFSQVLVE